jgi:hypothetical protein
MLLQSSGASVRTRQELLRHSAPVVTMGTYAKAVMTDKRNAQDLAKPINTLENGKTTPRDAYWPA